jgi:hypothetical protein
VVKAGYTQKCCPTKALDFITPEEIWSGRRPYNATCVCLGVSPTQWCRMHKGVSSMQRAQNVCFWVIVRGLRPIYAWVQHINLLSELMCLGVVSVFLETYGVEFS